MILGDIQRALTSLRLLAMKKKCAREVPIIVPEKNRSHLLKDFGNSAICQGVAEASASVVLPT